MRVFIFLMIVVPWGLLFIFFHNSGEIVKRTIQECFKQGNHGPRRKVLKTIVEAVEKEYTEDNWYSRLYWLVEEILKADDNLAVFEIDEKAVAAGLKDAVHDAIEYRKAATIK